MTGNSIHTSHSVIGGTSIDSIMAKVINSGGDLGKLSEDERVEYYKHYCNQVGLEASTQPFNYILLNGKLQLYATKKCSDQLRMKHNLNRSILKVEFNTINNMLYKYVYVRVQNSEGVYDDDYAVVCLEGLKGEALSNAEMKAVTKAKRRATLAFCGLGILDETEIEDVNGATKVDVDDSGKVTPTGNNNNGNANSPKNQGNPRNQKLVNLFNKGRNVGFNDLDIKQLMTDLGRKASSELTEDEVKLLDRIFEMVRIAKSKGYESMDGFLKERNKNKLIELDLKEITKIIDYIKAHPFSPANTNSAESGNATSGDTTPDTNQKNDGNKEKKNPKTEKISAILEKGKVAFKDEEIKKLIADFGKEKSSQLSDEELAKLDLIFDMGKALLENNYSNLEVFLNQYGKAKLVELTIKEIEDIIIEVVNNPKQKEANDGKAQKDNKNPEKNVRKSARGNNKEGKNSGTTEKESGDSVAK